MKGEPLSAMFMYISNERPIVAPNLSLEVGTTSAGAIYIAIKFQEIGYMFWTADGFSGEEP